MRYLTAEEIRQNKKELKDACLHEADSGMVGDGRAVAIAKKYTTSGAVMLDYGAGNGLFLKKIADEGFRNLFGVDIDDYRVYADQASGLIKQYVLIDVSTERLPWPDDFFDAVTAWEVMEHLENTYFAIRELARVIKPGGYFILSMPNVLHLLSRFIFLKNGELPRWSEENNHVAVYTPALFKKAFRQFDVVEKGYYRGEFSYRWLVHLPALPENKWFGNTAWWVLRRKS